MRKKGRKEYTFNFRKIHIRIHTDLDRSFEPSDLKSDAQRKSNILKIPFALDRLAFMTNVINEHTSLDGEQFMELFTVFYLELAKNNFIISEDASIGLILHLACAIEKLLSGEVSDFANSCTIVDMNKYGKSYTIVVAALRPIEESLHIKLPTREYCNIVDLMHYM